MSFVFGYHNPHDDHLIHVGLFGHQLYADIGFIANLNSIFFIAHHREFQRFTHFSCYDKTRLFRWYWFPCWTSHQYRNAVQRFPAFVGYPCR